MEEGCLSSRAVLVFGPVSQSTGLGLFAHHARTDSATYFRLTNTLGPSTVRPRGARSGRRSEINVVGLKGLDGCGPFSARPGSGVAAHKTGLCNRPGLRSTTATYRPEMWRLGSLLSQVITYVLDPCFWFSIEEKYETLQVDGEVWMMWKLLIQGEGCVSQQRYRPSDIWFGSVF